MPEFAEPRAFYLLVLIVPMILISTWFAGRRSGKVGMVALCTTGMVRLLAALCIVVAISRPLQPSEVVGSSIVVAVDVSASVDEAVVRAGVDIFNRTVAAKPKHGRVGLVAFADGATIDSPLTDSASLVERIESVMPGDRPDIARGIDAAAGELGSAGSRHLILVTDGLGDAEQARAAAARARIAGVGVTVVEPPAAVPKPDARVDRIAAPRRVRVREPYRIVVTVSLENGATGDRAELVVLRNGTTLERRDIDPDAPTRRHVLVDNLERTGLAEYEAIISMNGDRVPENNSMLTYVEARGPARVLHVHDEGDAPSIVSSLLGANGWDVEDSSVDDFPTTLVELGSYDLIVLNNVSAFDLSLGKLERLEDYVSEVGGGLLVLGGPRSYSAGGYQGTALERAIPVAMEVSTQVRIPTLLVVIMLDRSGSMANAEKLLIAKNAAVAAVDVLNPLDNVAVLSFDAAAEWSVPPTEVGDRRDVIARVGDIVPGGGTDLYGALDAAFRMLRGHGARIKHLIVLSDGLTDTGGDYAALTDRMRELGATVSTVTFGDDADRSLMSNIAQVGRGRYYHAADIRDVPRVFTSETMVISRALIVEETFTPKMTYPGEALKGFRDGEFPRSEDSFERFQSRRRKLC